MQHGTYYADIAILNPENDMWSTIGMQNEPFPNTTRAPYKTMIWEAISQCGGGVDYVSENILQQSMVKRGNLCFNQRKYNTLMLIDVERMHPETAQQLLQFVKTGGKLLCIGTIPYQSLGLSGDCLAKDSVVRSCFEQLQAFDDRFVFVEPPKEGFISWYDSLMRAEQLPHYLDIETPSPFMMQNRYTTDDGSEMLFIINSHRYQSHQTKITFHKALTHRRHPWAWDLQTGERYPLILNEDGSYDIDLGPAESMLIVFDRTSVSVQGNPSGMQGTPKGTSATNRRELRSAVGASCYARDHTASVDLSTDWDVELIHARLDTILHTHFDTLFDLKDHPETQHFAGTIVYRKTIPMDTLNPCVLDLGLVEGISEVFVNGQSAGVKYYGRRQYDISNLLREGENNLEIRVTTTLGNYLKTLTKEENPTTWIYVNHPKRDQPLQPTGLIGPVKLAIQ